MESNSVGRRIAQLRRQNNWSQMELAEKINVSDKAVSKWENGGMPSVDLLPKLSKVFNVSIDYLLLGESEYDSTGEYDESEDLSDDDSFSDEMTKFKDNIGSLGVKELQLIILDQKNLYTKKEFQIIEERYDELMGENSFKMLQKDSKDRKLPRNYVCPECEGINPDPDQYCKYCGCNFFDPEKTREDEEEEEKRERDNNVVGCGGYVVAFFFPLIGVVWGLAKRDTGAVAFSIIIMILNIIGSMMLFPLFLQ